MSLIARYLRTYRVKTLIFNVLSKEMQKGIPPDLRDVFSLPENARIEYIVRLSPNEILVTISHNSFSEVPLKKHIPIMNSEVSTNNLPEASLSINMHYGPDIKSYEYKDGELLEFEYMGGEKVYIRKV